MFPNGKTIGIADTAANQLRCLCMGKRRNP